jgi:hypothetical protein
VTHGIDFNSALSDTSPATILSLSPGQLLADGRYRIDQFLGRGGMGAVFLATDLTLARSVAVKVMLSRAASAARNRFLAEAQVAAQMDHPHLVRVFDFVQGPTDVLVMEFVDGSNAGHLLAEALRAGKSGGLEARTALRILRDVLDGLAALHGRGIVHRDLKPGNFLIRRHDSRVKLSDFGLAIPSSEARAGFAGTFGYAAPEVEREEPATAASDIFSAGVSLYELLLNAKPRPGKPAKEIAEALSRFGDRLVNPLADFLARCLATLPRERYATAREALAALDGAVIGETAGVPARESPARLLPNRIALVLRDGDLAGCLATALTAGGLLSPVLTVSHPDDPRLRGALGQLDAIILDPEAAEPEAIARFVGGVRQDWPTIVFFLALQTARWEAVSAAFSPAWRQRFGHYFKLPLDTPLRELPRVVRDVAKMILFDQPLSGLPKAAQEAANKLLFDEATAPPAPEGPQETV